ncbi:MAG: cytochrome c, class I [Rhodospirillales bacterium]|nr:MAG: cytochrome c, class I [Rhodospirillales bacterium]
MKRFRRAAGLAVAVGMVVGLAAGPALAISDEEASVLADGCANCHAMDGRIPPDIPPIIGKPARVLQAQLLAFKADEVPNTTIMNRLARGFTDEQIEAIARHLAAANP